MSLDGRRPRGHSAAAQQLDVKVVPKASRDAIVGWLGDALKLAVVAAPEKGRANAAVERLLAERLGLAPSAVSVVAGHGNSRKRVAITGLDAEQLQARLAAILAGR